ncbi:MAG: type II secretion system F family protein [Clostridiales bacterium]
MLKNQFRDMLYVLSASISAGRSVEKAFMSLADDLSIEYKNKDEFIIRESIYIRRRICINESIENILRDFSTRSGLEDIKNFVSVFISCKKTGGNMALAINETSKVISEKIKIINDINISISSRKLEIKILNIMPFVLIIFISLTSKDYFDPLYCTIIGRIASTIALILLGLSNYLSYKIMNIEV